MKLSSLLAALAAVIAIPAAAQETYVFDNAHSQPGFQVTHMGVTAQFGGFGKSTGTVTLDRAAKKGTVDVSIDAASVRTFDPRLDNAIKGEKFFNVEKFPTLTFKSTEMTFDGDKVVGVKGDLTMIGVTKPVSLAVADFKCFEKPFNKKPMCAANASALIKRSDWGMTAGAPYAPADEVKLLIPIEAYKQ